MLNITLSRYWEADWLAYDGGLLGMLLQPSGSSMIRFFVSYNKADKAWAEWIAWILDLLCHRVIIQAWDFRPGGNFVLDMQRAAADADKTIAVLSEDYLNAEFTQPEWAAAFAEDATSSERNLIPIRVGECEPSGLLRPLVYVDLVDLEADAARQAIFGCVARAGKAGV